MVDEHKVQFLSRFAIFQGIAKKELLKVTSLFEEKIIPAHTTFIKEGSTSDELYCILSGLVRIYNLHESGKEVTVTIRMPGEVIGEMAILNDKPRSASAESLEEVHVLVIKKKDLITVLDLYPSVGLHILRILSERLREAIHTQKLSSFAPLEERIYHILTILSEYFSSDGVKLTHEQLSVLVNATQPRVTEALNELQKHNKISLFRKRILIN